MVNQILNTPHDLEFAGRWLSSQFKLSPKRKRKSDPKLSAQIKELEEKLKEAKKAGVRDNPLLKKQLEQTQKDLNLILNKWTFGETPIKSAQEFLNNFEPWINKQLEKQKELKEFLTEQGAENLTKLKELWKNTESDYLKTIRELKENRESKDYEELEIERDELAREKKTLEQELLSLNNQARNKNKEVQNKEKEIERLKKDWRDENEGWRKKYSKQGKLLDEEMLENNKLNEKIEQLENKIKELKEHA